MNTEKVSRIEVLKYSPELFVTGKLGMPNSRMTDLVYFSDFLKSKTNKLFQVNGPKGIGKSWFLLEAHRRLSEDFELDQEKNHFLY